MKPWNEYEYTVHKVEGFFADCRAELGYTKFLTEQGRMILEDAAMENSSTYEGVYNYLKECLNAPGI